MKATVRHKDFVIVKWGNGQAYVSASVKVSSPLSPVADLACEYFTRANVSTWENRGY